MLVHTADILLACLWGLVALCVSAPVMMLGRAYQASHVNYYHYRGYHVLEKQYHIKYVRLYAALAALGLFILGAYLFLL